MKQGHNGNMVAHYSNLLLYMFKSVHNKKLGKKICVQVPLYCGILHDRECLIHFCVFYRSLESSKSLLNC